MDYVLCSVPTAKYSTEKAGVCVLCMRTRVCAYANICALVCACAKHALLAHALAAAHFPISAAARRFALAVLTLLYASPPRTYRACL